MKIVIIRHAEPDYEKHSLTNKGFREAKMLGEYYKDAKIDALYSSPLPRAYLTAKALANDKHEIIVKDWLEEFWNPIHIDGRERHNWDFYPRDIKNYPVLIKEEFLDSDFGKEVDLRIKYDAVIKSFDELIESHGYKYNGCYYDAVKPNKDTIVIVCHLGMEALLMSRLIHAPYNLITQYFFAAPSSVTIFVSEEREEGKAQFRCREFGNIIHLKNNNEPHSKFGSFAETYDSKDEMH